MTLDGKRLAALIDTARAAASISAESWQKQADESPIKKAIDYVKDGHFIPSFPNDPH